MQIIQEHSAWEYIKLSPIPAEEIKTCVPGILKSSLQTEGRAKVKRENVEQK